MFGGDAMKIREIEAIPVEVPRLQIDAAHATFTFSKFTIVLVRTDNGMEGLGEASIESPWTGEDPHACAHIIRTYLARALEGHDVRRIQDANRIMDRAIAANPYAKAAIEMALWDLAGKSANMPLHDLWGGKVRERVAIKFVVSGSPAKSAAMAKRALKRGFRYIKIKTGHDLEEDIARVRTVRKAVGAKVPVGIDSNQGWSFTDTMKALPALEAANISFIEQPFNRHPMEAWADLRRRTRIPLVAHESLFTVDDARELAKHRLVDVFAVTPPTHGSYVATRDILAIAQANQIPCLLGSTIELGITSAFMAHIGVSHPCFDGTVPSDIVGPFYHDEDIVNEKFPLVDSGVAPPRGPGLGVTLNRKVLKKYRSD